MMRRFEFERTGRYWCAAIYATFALLILGCGDSTSASGSAGTTVLGTAEVSPEGGHYVIGPITLDLEPNAVDAVVVVKAVQTGSAESPLVTPPISLQPKSLTFSAAATLGLQYASSANGAPTGDLALGMARNGRYAMMAGSFQNIGARTVGAPISGLGTFGAVRISDEGLSIPPSISALSPSVQFLPSGTPSPVTWTWQYERPPTPEPTCTLEPSGEAVTQGSTITMTVDGPTRVTLTCSNEAGEGRAEVELGTAVAPKLGLFWASPPFVPAEAVPVTFGWTYATPPLPAPVCTVDHGVGEVSNGETRSISLPPTSLDRAFEVTCSNSAGSDSRTVLIGSAPDVFPSISLDPEGGVYELGLVRIEVPAGAVSSPVDVSLHWATSYSSSPGLIGIPLDFQPSGLVFNEPIKVSFRYDPAYLDMFGVTDTALELHAAYDTPEGWRQIASTVEPGSNTVTAYVNHFTNIAYETTRNGAETKPTASAFQVVSKAEEVAIFLPDEDEGAAGEVWEDLGQSGSWANPTKLGSISDAMCTNKGFGGHIVKTVGADLDADGRRELAVLCEYAYERVVHFYDAQKIRYRKHFQVIIFDDAKSGLTKKIALDTGTWAEGAPPTDRSYYDADLAGWNPDDDLAEELVFTASHERIDDNLNGIPDGANIWILDDLVQSLKLLKKVSISGAQQVRLSSGNVDDDEYHELVLAWRDASADTSVMQVWDDRASTFSILREFRNVAGSNLFKSGRRGVSVAAADVDGDTRTELVATATAGLQAPKVLEVFDDAHDGWGMISQHVISTANDATNISFDAAPAQMSAAEVDGDYIQDVALLMHTTDDGWLPYVYRYLYRPTVDQPTKVDKVVGLRRARTDVGTVLEWPMKYAAATLAVGDVDQDRKDEVLIAWRTRPEYTQCPTTCGSCTFTCECPSGCDCDNQCTCDTPASYSVSKTDLSNADDSGSTVVHTFDIESCADLGDAPVVGVADLDGDDIYLQYTGNHDPEVQSDPIPLIAMAAPPHFRVLTQNYKDTETNTRLQDLGSPNYGTSNSLGEANASSVGVKLGTSATTQVGGSYKIFNFGVGMSRAWDESYSSSVSNKKEVSYGTNYAGSSTEDHIVFVIQHYVSYEYRIIGHPDPSFRPQYDAATDTWSYKYVSIDVPTGDPISYNWATRQFVETYPQFAHWLDGVFSHVPGFPDTYPSHEAVDALIKNPTPGASGQSATDDPNDSRYGGWWKDGEYLTVPIGENSSTEAFYQVSTEKTNGWRHTSEYTTSWSVTLPLLGTRGQSVTQSLEHSYEVTAGQEVRYAGSVGGVVTGCFDPSNVASPAVGPCADFDAWPYDWNMFVYNRKPVDPTSPPFQVLGFWVDDTLYSASAFWTYYESFAHPGRVASVAQVGDWAKVANNHVSAGSYVWDVCGLVNGVIQCRDNPSSDPKLFDGAGLLRFEASFDEPTVNEYVIFDGKVVDGSLAPTPGLELEVRYRVTGTSPALQEATLGIVPTDPSQYWSFHRFKLVSGSNALPPRSSELAAIPNAKGMDSNPFDTGWQTQTFDLGQLGYGFDRINLVLDDADDATGTYRMYVDYVRIFSDN